MMIDRKWRGDNEPEDIEDLEVSDIKDVFLVDSGRVHVSDPCYTLGNEDGMFDLRVRRGYWRVRIVPKMGRIGELSVYHIGDYKPEILGIDKNFGILDETRRLQKILRGKYKKCFDGIGVDSGQCGIFDSLLYPKGDTGEYGDTDSFYGKCCDATVGDNRYGIVDGRGVVSESGFGDGVYKLYELEEKGEIIALKIIFIEEK